MTVTHKPKTFTAEEMAYVFQAVTDYHDYLDRHISWLKNRQGEPLPGTDVAISEMHKEMDIYRELKRSIHKEAIYS